MTAFATVLAILRAGATPVLADIEPDTALLSINSVKRCFSSKTRAVVLVHLYGQVRNMTAWQKFANEQNIHLIEDCAQSHLASLHGKIAGSFGVAGAYSFYPTKNLGALGDAGILITSNSELAERATSLRNYGQSVRYHHPERGMNSRLDELQAAVLMERLKWLPEFTARRQTIAKAFRAEIRNPLVSLLHEPQEQGAHVYHLFVVTCLHREALQKHLASAGVQTLIHYPVPLHRQKSCLDIRVDSEGLRYSEIHAKTCLSIPCHPQMRDKDISVVIDKVNSFRLA
jgi:dTDP-4-amino-4,6-dideoxygalactose transaminase